MAVTGICVVLVLAGLAPQLRWPHGGWTHIRDAATADVVALALLRAVGGLERLHHTRWARRLTRGRSIGELRWPQVGACSIAAAAWFLAATAAFQFFALLPAGAHPRIRLAVGFMAVAWLTLVHTRLLNRAFFPPLRPADTT